MNEDRIQQAFAFAAGEAAPPPDLYQRIALELQSRPARRPVGRSVTAAAAGIALAFGLTVAAVPGVRAAAENLVAKVSRAVFQGQVGTVPVDLRWADQEQAQQLFDSGTAERISLTPVASLADAAKKVGFDPVVLPGRAYSVVTVTADVFERNNTQSRIVTLDYNLGGQTYSLATEAAYLRANDQWQATERKALSWLWLGTQPSNPEVVTVGQVQALCFSVNDFYACGWIQGGRNFSINGPDRQGVLDLVKEVAR